MCLSRCCTIVSHHWPTCCFYSSRTIARYGWSKYSKGVSFCINAPLWSMAEWNLKATTLQGILGQDLLLLSICSHEQTLPSTVGSESGHDWDVWLVMNEDMEKEIKTTWKWFMKIRSYIISISNTNCLNLIIKILFYELGVIKKSSLSCGPPIRPSPEEYYNKMIYRYKTVVQHKGAVEKVVQRNWDTFILKGWNK